MCHRGGRTAYERRLGFAIHIFSGSDAPAARVFSRAVCWPRDRQRRGGVILTSALSAASRMSCRPPLASARSRAQGAAMQAGSLRVETFVAFVRPPMQKFGFHIFLPDEAKSPNHALQLTASRRTAQFFP